MKTATDMWCPECEAPFKLTALEWSPEGDGLWESADVLCDYRHVVVTLFRPKRKPKS